MNDKTEETTEEVSEVEGLQNQLNYAQKIINVLQSKLNELNGKQVQLEAQLLIANEAKTSQ